MLQPTETEGEITFIYQTPISAETASSSIHILIVLCGSRSIPPSVQVLWLSQVVIFRALRKVVVLENTCTAM